MEPSTQQRAIMRAVRKNDRSLLVQSVAGSGKTTSLLLALEEMKGEAALAAYNKSIATELKEKVAKAGLSDVTVGTFHSFGFAAIRQQSPRVSVESKKTALWVNRLNVPPFLTKFVTDLVGKSKQQLLKPDAPEEAFGTIIEHYGLDELLPISNAIGETMAEGVELVRHILTHSIAESKRVIDFDDMIYLPGITPGMVTRRYDWVLVDEAQDTNPGRRELARQMLKKDGKVLAVGDPHQAIYGFTGADSDSMDLIAATFNMKRLPLTVSYRCPKAVVREAQQWVTHITSAPDAPEGRVATMTMEAFGKMMRPEELTTGDAILCRTTRPLIEMAYRLIAKKVRCHVEGRDLGTGLIRLVQRFAKATTVLGVMTLLEEFVAREVPRLLTRDKDADAERLTDRWETLQIFAEGLADDAPVSELVRSITGLFGDTPEGMPSTSLTLSTIHKAKGREWDRVFWLGKNALQPSKWARKEWQMGQEVNLMYVAATRAKSELIHITL